MSGRDTDDERAGEAPDDADGDTSAAGREPDPSKQRRDADAAAGKKPKKGKNDRVPTKKEEEPEEETRLDRAKANVKTIGGAILLAIFIRIVLFEAFEIEGPSMEPTLLNGDRVVVAKFMYGLFLPYMNDAVVNWGVPNRGDIIILRSPERGQEEVDIVKRVIGLPGDSIEVRRMGIDCGNGEWGTRDVIVVNGEELTYRRVDECVDPNAVPGFDDGACACEIGRETMGGGDALDHLVSNSYRQRRYDDPGDLSSPMRVLGPVTVGADEVYVLGDHRDASNDSRNEMLGAIPLTRVKGRALFIYWSNSPDEGPRWDRLGTGLH